MCKSCLRHKIRIAVDKLAILTKNHHVQEIRPSQKHVVHAGRALFMEVHCIFKSFTVCDGFAWDFWTVPLASSVPLRATSDTLSHSQSSAG